MLQRKTTELTIETFERLTITTKLEAFNLKVGIPAMEETRTCYSLRCGHTTVEKLDQCPKCGGRLRPARQIRRLGWGQLLVGLILLGLMGTVAFNLAPELLQPGVSHEGTIFTGTAAQAQLAIGLFTVVIVFALGT